MRTSNSHEHALPVATPATQVATDALALSSALLASLSHDLRNPLSVIMGAADMLQTGVAHLLDVDQHAHLRAIRRESVRMDEYAQGLMQVTRLLVGGAVAREPVGVDALVASAVERLMRYRDDARVDIELPASLQPVHVHGSLVEQAILNVLDNAAKFSPLGASVRVRVTQRACGETHVDVHDEGPGIPPAQHERVFGFFVSDDPQDRGRNGSGLGLAISRSILRAQGGDVLVVQDGLRLVLPAADRQ